MEGLVAQLIFWFIGVIGFILLFLMFHYQKIEETEEREIEREKEKERMIEIALEIERRKKELE